MRARERARCERAAEALLPGVVVVWAREIPHAYAYALWPSGIVLCEASFGKAPAHKRWTLIAHEIAHLIAWREHGTLIQDHGREWRRAYRKILTDNP